MTDGVLVSIIAGGFTVLVALIERVHRMVNSRMTEMLDTVRKLGHATGVTDEKTRADAEKGSKML